MRRGSVTDKNLELINPRMYLPRSRTAPGHGMLSATAGG